MPRDPKKLETDATARPKWLVGDVVRVDEVGRQQQVTDMSTIESLPKQQPDYVLIERLPNGDERTLIYDIKGPERGEMVGHSSEAPGPNFRVVDNEKGREGFDRLTVAALQRLGLDVRL